MADVLYGITMEKSGISKVISVRFRERHDPRQKVMEEIIEEETGDSASIQPAGEEELAADMTSDSGDVATLETNPDGANEN